MNSMADCLREMIRAHGFILFTERYESCLAFYRDTLELPVWFEKEGLCCLHFGEGYLMIETGGHASGKRKSESENPTILRLNVDDVDAAAELLVSQGVEVERRDFDWGKIGIFADPDGNVCELKDAGDPYFARPGSKEGRAST